MGSPIVRRGVDLTTGKCKKAPTTFIQGSPDVFVNGISVVRQGDVAAPHKSKSKHTGHVAVGGGTVYVNGKLRQTVGDALDCGDTSAQGSSDVYAG